MTDPQLTVEEAHEAVTVLRAVRRTIEEASREERSLLRQFADHGGPEVLGYADFPSCAVAALGCPSVAIAVRVMAEARSEDADPRLRN